MRGRVEAGKSGGGITYGYDVVRGFKPDGSPVTGERTINQAEAAVVQRIFEQYGAGVPPKKIALALNAARATGLGRQDALVCGTLMNMRALMELVVLNVGLDLGVLPPKVFTMLVIMAVGSTIMTAPLLRVALKRAGYAMPLGTEA